MPLRSPADGDDAKGVSQERKPEYGTFSASKGPKYAEKPAPNPSEKPPDPAPSKSPEKTLPPLHPESPATAWWRKLFFEFFDKKQLDSELDASQVWELTAEHTSVEAAAAFRQVYAQSLQCRSNCRIKSAIIRTHKWKLAACWALQLASLLCDACTPVLLYMLLAMAISREYTQTQIYASLGLLYVTALGEVLLHCHSHFLGFKINIKIVGALRALVFENTISQPEHIPGHAAGSYDSESGKKRMAEVAHLYAEDVANVARMVTHMQFLWRSVLQIVFELCILVQVIGIKFKPVAIAFLSMAVFAKFLSAAGSRLQRKLQKKIEARLNVIHECFKGIQMVKLNAWEDKMQDKIERAGKEENRERRRVNLVAALQYCVGVDSPNMASIFIFGWVAMQDTSALSPARVFPALLLLRRIKTHFSNTAQLFDVVVPPKSKPLSIDMT
ncbi:hypothetical protein PR001_g19792 [Phytophthora rubi]|uniref:ABC transmembrane type-1 domain-containing protein n=1 Tax=Phytophthora rubi TaxID=129364 RepID=A0A6A3JN50_9STRA|nr:hypothetical protein PR002_g21417 [Phytophthora rubi]KAE8996676.1 hypothetical protein PR001_g19792 [Phytophthora rubi]